MNLQTDQLVVEVFALRQNHVGTSDVKHFAFIGESGVHVLHTGKFQQDQLLVDVVGGGGDGLAVNVKGFAAGEQCGGDPAGLHPHLAPDAVGVDDAAHTDIFLLHRKLLVLCDIPIIYVFARTGNRRLRPGRAAG